MKATQIIPPYKKGKYPTSTIAYRGVKIIPFISKIVDKVLLKQIMKHLENHDLIPHHHHGGVPGKSTASTMVTLIDSWTKSLESGDDSMSMAYNLVDHCILLKKLKIFFTRQALPVTHGILPAGMPAGSIPGRTDFPNIVHRTQICSARILALLCTIFDLYPGSTINI